MRVSIHQPNIFPRMKTLAKIFSAQRTLVLEHVQFVKREWQNRLYLRPYDNPKHYVRVSFPVHAHRNREFLISETNLIEFHYNFNKFLETARHCYHLSPFEHELNDFLLSINNYEIRTVSDFGIVTLMELAQRVSLPLEIVSAPPNNYLRRSHLLIWLCQNSRSSDYITGSGGLSYMHLDLFAHADIKVCIQKAVPPDSLDWSQASSLDFIARYGFVGLRNFLSRLPEPEYV